MKANSPGAANTPSGKSGSKKPSKLSVDQKLRCFVIPGDSMEQLEANESNQLCLYKAKGMMPSAYIKYNHASTTYILHVEGLEWEFINVWRAIECLVKLIYILNIEYNATTKPLYEFLLELLCDISVKSKHVSVLSAIHWMKREEQQSTDRSQDAGDDDISSNGGDD